MMRAKVFSMLLLLAALAGAQSYTVEKVSFGVGEGSWKAFGFPSDVWVDENSSRMFISDPFNYAIQVFTPDLEHLSVIGGSINSPAALSQPRSVTFALGKIYVVDQGVGGVKVFDSGYNLYKTISSGGSAYLFNMPSGIAVDSERNVYVSDTGNNRIQVYDDSLEYKYTIGGYGTVGDNVLNSPRGLFIKDDLLYIADSNNNRIKVVYTNGTFVKSIGIGAGGVSLYQPADVAVGIDNKVYVADMLNNRIVIFSPSGSPLTTIDRNLSGLFLNRPTGIYVDSMDKIYVVDTENGRVLVLKPTSEIPAIAVNASDEIEAAASEIALFNALLSDMPPDLNFTEGDRGAASYLELARSYYDAKEYGTASESARLARALVAEARASLEGILNESIQEELESILARLDLYDQNITAGELDLSTIDLRMKAEGVGEKLENQDYVGALSFLASLREGADSLESEINDELEKAKRGREELMAALDWLLNADSALKERASIYRQELNTSLLDAQIENASFLLSRDLFSATMTYEAALQEYMALNSTLEQTIGKIIDANASIEYAERIIAEAKNISSIFAEPDMSAALQTLDEAKRALYSNPVLSKELATEAIEQAEAERERMLAAEGTVLQGAAYLLLILVAAFLFVWFVYKMRLRKRLRKLEELSGRVAPPPAAKQEPRPTEGIKGQAAPVKKQQPVRQQKKGKGR